MVVKVGKGLSVIKRCSTFLTPHSKKQVQQALVLSYLDQCQDVWPSAARKDLVKLHLAQNRAAHLALHCNQRADTNTTHATFFFIRNNVLNIPNSLHSQLTRSTDTHTYFTRHTTRGLFTIPRSRTNSRKHTVLYTSHIEQVNSKPGSKKHVL